VGDEGGAYRVEVAPKPHPQLFDGARVDLGDTRLVHTQHFADFLHRELFVVVERYDEPFAIGKIFDAPREERHHLAAFQSAMRIDRAIVTDERVEILQALYHFGARLGTPHFDDDFAELFHAHTELTAELEIAGRTPELCFEATRGRVELPAPAPYRTRHPVERSKAIQDRASDPELRVGPKAHPFALVVLGRRVEQPHETRLGQVRELYPGGKAAQHVERHATHEREELLDAAISTEMGHVGWLQEMQEDCQEEPT